MGATTSVGHWISSGALFYLNGFSPFRVDGCDVCFPTGPVGPAGEVRSPLTRRLVVVRPLNAAGTRLTANGNRGDHTAFMHLVM